MKLKPGPATAVAIVVGVSISLAPLREVFPDWTSAARVIGAVAFAAVIAVVIESRWQLSTPVVAAIAAVGAALWGVTVMTDSFRREPVSRLPWLDLRDGVLDGWGALLDRELPLSDAPTAEMFVAMVAWTLTAAAIHLTVRRGTATATVAVCAAILWVSVAAALPRELTPAVFGAATGVGVLLVVATLAGASDGRWRPGRAPSLILILGSVVLIATVAGEIGTRSRDQPIDPRSNRDTSIVSIEVPDILGDFANQLDGDTEVLIVESTTSTPAPTLRLRLQVYDVHDGEHWIPATEYREVATFPEPDILPAGELVSLAVTLRSLPGPWVPLPDRLVSIDLRDIKWSEPTQTALFGPGIRSYELTGTVVDRAGLEGLPSARGEVDDRFTEVPAGLPDSIRSTARQLTGSAADALASVDALAAALREMGRDDSVAPGQSLARLRDDLARGEPTGAVQLVSLHALMARTLGHPARVVVGYVTDDSTVTASDLSVWTEIAFPGVGWVAVDPLPSPTDPSEEAVPDLSSTTTTIPEDTVGEARAFPRELGPGEDPEQIDISSARDYRWRDVIAGFAILVTLTLFGLIGARLLRRRIRRSQSEAETKVLGAWAELLDRLREAGAPIAITTTVDDAVFMAEQMDDGLGLVARDLGAVASRSLHGPRASTRADADAAWQALDEAETILVRVRGRRSLITRFVDPRLLRHRAPLPPPSRSGSRRSRTLS